MHFKEAKEMNKRVKAGAYQQIHDNVKSTRNLTDNFHYPLRQHGNVSKMAKNLSL